MDFFNKIKHVRSYSIYKHDTTLKMAFGANFILANFNTGPPINMFDGTVDGLVA